jgi:hypothetical protein
MAAKPRFETAKRVVRVQCQPRLILLVISLSYASFLFPASGATGRRGEVESESLIRPSFHASSLVQGKELSSSPFFRSHSFATTLRLISPFSEVADPAGQKDKENIASLAGYASCGTYTNDVFPRSAFQDSTGGVFGVVTAGNTDRFVQGPTNQDVHGMCLPRANDF